MRKRNPRKIKVNQKLRDTLIRQGLLTEAPCDCTRFGRLIPYKWNNRLELWFCPAPGCGAEHARRRLCQKTGEVLPAG